MAEMTPADMAAMMNNNEFGGNGAWWIIILFLFVFMGGGFGFNRNVGMGDFSQFASSASQQEILWGQKFGDLDNKIDRIGTNLGNGICDSTYALNNAITGEGRALQTMGYQNALSSQSAMFGLQTQLSDQHAALAAAIHYEGESTRQLMQQQEAQRLRDELGVARDTISNNQQSAYILQQLGRWVANPPCNPTCNCNPCGCAMQYT